MAVTHEPMQSDWATLVGGRVDVEGVGTFEIAEVGDERAQGPYVSFSVLLATTDERTELDAASQGTYRVQGAGIDARLFLVPISPTTFESLTSRPVAASPDPTSTNEVST